MPLPPGQIVNHRYRVVKLLGQGGFGAVYRVWDLNMERPRALKENLETGPEAQRQFKREAQILGDLTHANLTKVIDHFVIPEQGQYLVMEYVEGDDLEERLTRHGGALPEAQVLPWMIQICEALSYLHTQTPPIIHRDIKPANIKIRADGRAILVDFGIAKMYAPQEKTTWGARAVTPGYSPQEQYGLGATDARTDIYALGATLYNLLTGNEPVESVQRNYERELEAPRKTNPQISVSTEAVILKAMEMHPNQRFQSAAEMRAALAAASQPPAAERVNPLPARIADAVESPAPALVRPSPAVIPKDESQGRDPVSSPPVQAVARTAVAVPATGETPAIAPAQLAATAATPLASPAWPLIAAQAAALALAGVITIINRGVYLLDNGDTIFILTLLAFYLLVCGLIIIDGVRQARAQRQRKVLTLALGAAALTLPLVVGFATDSEPAANLTVLFFSVLIGNGLLLLAVRLRDARTGLLGAALFAMVLQGYILVRENWDLNWSLAIFFGMIYLVIGAAVLINARPGTATAEPVRWWVAAALSAGLALVGVVMIVTDLLDIWDLDLVERSVQTFYHLAAGLIIADALTLRRPGALSVLRRIFGLIFPPLAIFIPPILGNIDYNQGNTVFVLSLAIMAAALLALAWKSGDRRLGLLGALFLPLITQTYWWLMPENWDAIASTAIPIGLLYVLAGGAVLARTLLRRGAAGRVTPP